MTFVSAAATQPPLDLKLVQDDEVGPEAVFIHRTIESEALRSGALTSRPIDVSRWYLVQADRGLTWCGFDIGYGNR